MLNSLCQGFQSLIKVLVIFFISDGSLCEPLSSMASPKRELCPACCMRAKFQHVLQTSFSCDSTEIVAPAAASARDAPRSPHLTSVCIHTCTLAIKEKLVRTLW